MTHRPTVDEPACEISYKEILTSWIGLIAVFLLMSGLVHGYYLLFGPSCPNPEAVMALNLSTETGHTRPATKVDDFENDADRAAALIGLGTGSVENTAQSPRFPARSAVQQVQACELSEQPGEHTKPGG